MVTPVYPPRDPSGTLLYQVIADHLETFRGTLAADPTAKIHTLIPRTIGQYYVNQAVKQGATRATVQPGSVTFLQRFGGSITLNLHYHVVFLEGVFVDRAAQGLKPHYRPAIPPTDADITTVLQKISHRVIRELRQLGYLAAGTPDVVPTGYDPASDEDPELARTLAASVQQRIAFGERAGQKVQRIGSGFGDEGENPTLMGNRCASVNGFSLHANTQVPAHRRDELERLLRYTARGAAVLERLEEGADGDLLYTFTRPWSDGTTGIKLSPLGLFCLFSCCWSACRCRGFAGLWVSNSSGYWALS